MSSVIQFKDLNIRRFAVDQASHFIAVIFDNAAGARSDDRPDCLHDMRVASRRLRETFQLFSMFYRQSKLKKVRSQVKRMTRILGSPREMDVNVTLLREFRHESDPMVQAAHEHLLEAFERRQAKVRRRMQRALDHLDLKKLRAEWMNFAQGPLLEPEPSSVLRGIQREFESEAYLRQTIAILGQEAIPVLAFQEMALRSESDEELHRLRIALKKLRYSLEIYNPLHQQHFGQAIDSTKELQEILGQAHDCFVLLQQIRSHRDHLQARSHLRLASGCEPLIQFFEAKREALCPSIEPAYLTAVRELNALLSVKPRARISLVKRKRPVRSNRSGPVPLVSKEDAGVG
jgi:CHAD domain-containing protein